MDENLTVEPPHVLAVTADPTVAQQLADQLGREFQVTVVQTANAALATLEETSDVESVDHIDGRVISSDGGESGLTGREASSNRW